MALDARRSLSLVHVNSRRERATPLGSTDIDTQLVRTPTAPAARAHSRAGPGDPSPDAAASMQLAREQARAVARAGRPGAGLLRRTQRLEVAFFWIPIHRPAAVNRPSDKG